MSLSKKISVYVGYIKLHKSNSSAKKNQYKESMTLPNFTTFVFHVCFIRIPRL